MIFSFKYEIYSFVNILRPIVIARHLSIHWIVHGIFYYFLQVFRQKSDFSDNIVLCCTMWVCELQFFFLDDQKFQELHQAFLSYLTSWRNPRAMQTRHWAHWHRQHRLKDFNKISVLLLLVGVLCVAVQSSKYIQNFSVFYPLTIFLLATSCCLWEWVCQHHVPNVLIIDSRHQVNSLRWKPSFLSFDQLDTVHMELLCKCNVFYSFTIGLPVMHSL